MSLRVGKAFIKALRTNEALMRRLGGQGNPPTGARVFPVARCAEDEEADTVPYIILIPEGINAEGTKDRYEDGDTAQVSLLVVAKTYNELCDLAQSVRDTLASELQAASEGESFRIDDYTFSANAVQMDIEKPCYFQTLTYQVNTQEEYES